MIRISISQAITLLSNQLDLKHNSNKTIIDLLQQLQTGTSLTGVVSEKPGNDGTLTIKFPQGQLEIPAGLNLKARDVISLQKNEEQEKISITITKVNHKQLSPEEQIKLLIEPVNQTQKPITSKITKPVELELNHKIPKTLDGEITYLNLSKLPEHSKIFSVLQLIKNTSNNVPITLSITQHDELTNSPYEIIGEVVSEFNQITRSQLVRTDFGVINIKDAHLQNGQILNLNINSLGNTNLFKDYEFFSFILTISQNWEILAKLYNSLLTHTPKTQKQRNNLLQKADLAALSYLLQNQAIYERNIEFARSDFIMMPFYIDNKLHELEVTISRSAEGVLNFHVSYDLEENSKLKLIGSVGLEKSKPTWFDLIVESSKPLSSEMQTKVTEIFNLAQNFSGIRGGITFIN